MAITKFFVQGNPADDGEITQSFGAGRGRLDAAAGAGPLCASFRAEAAGEDIGFYDIKQAFTYVLGDWSVIFDNDRDPATFDVSIVVTNNVGAFLRNVHDFGTITVGTGGDDTHTATSVAEQTLLSTERLAVWMIYNDAQEDRAELQIDNINTTCDSRLVTPDEAAGGAALSHPLVINPSLTI